MVTEALPRRWFLGVPFTPLTLTEASDRIAARDPEAPFAFVTTPNAQQTVHVDRGDALLAKAHDQSWLVLNDSRILRLLSRTLFGEDLSLAAGSDLTVDLLTRHLRPDDTVTIIGGTDEVERRLRTQFGLRRIARHDPPMGFYRDEAAIERCVAFIEARPARYVFLATGCPQSEMLAGRVLEQGQATGVGLCIGSSLHFATGVVSRAPLWVRRAHLESIYRLLQNPRRHARRVFHESIPVLGIAARLRAVPPSRRRHQRREPTP